MIILKKTIKICTLIVTSGISIIAFLIARKHRKEADEETYREIQKDDEAAKVNDYSMTSITSDGL